MSMPAPFMRLAAIVLAFGAAGCTYYERRETISLHAGDAVASNIAIHTIDPWPYSAGDQTIPGDGHRAAAAMERYRTGKATPPQGIGTSALPTAVGAQSQ